MAQRTETAVQFPPTLAARAVNLVIHAILILGAIFMVLPMVWMVTTSFKLPPEIAVWPPHLLPEAPTFNNYTGIFDVAPFGRYFFNSVFMSLVATASVC